MEAKIEQNKLEEKKKIIEQIKNKFIKFGIPSIVVVLTVILVNTYRIKYYIPNNFLMNGIKHMDNGEYEEAISDLKSAGDFGDAHKLLEDARKLWNEELERQRLEELRQNVYALLNLGRADNVKKEDLQELKDSKMFNDCEYYFGEYYYQLSDYDNTIVKWKNITDINAYDGLAGKIKHAEEQ